MFFPDKVAAYKETRRVLRSGGHFIFNVWDQISENEFADVVTQALAAIFPDDPPRFMARTPHGYHDVEQIRRELSAAGFSDIAIDAVDEKSKAPSSREAAVAYCHGTPLRNEIEARDASRLEHATAQAAAALARRFGNGKALIELQRMQDLYCATWTECVWQIADASQSQTKFIISDHPVTVYNRACPHLSKYCSGANDPDIT